MRGYNAAVIRILLALVLSMQTCIAAEVVVQPETASTERMQQMISGGFSYATLNIRGEGKSLLVKYSSSAPLDTYIIYMREDETINPRDILFAKLPASAEEALIPLTITRGWSAGEQNLRIHFLTDKDAEHTVSSVTLSEESLRTGGLRQYLSPEPFVPSAYHRLEGYKLLGRSATALLTTSLVVLLLLALLRKNRKAALMILLVGLLIHNGRFSLDTLRYTTGNTQEWMKNNTYAAAGSTYEIATFLNENGIEKFRLCTDGNSFFPVLMQYAAYPAVLEYDSSHVLVRNSFDWSYENGILRCSDIERPSELMKIFPDGTQLFSLSP